MEPEGLFDDHLEVGKIGDVGFLDESGFSDDGVEFLDGFGHDFGVVDEF